MSANQKQNKKDYRSGKHEETKSNQKQLMLEASIASGHNSGESELLAELKKLRQEDGYAFRETKQSLGLGADYDAITSGCMESPKKQREKK